MTTPSHATVILAAGVGQRMGAPKALLLIDGVPLALAHTRARRLQGSDPVVVVLRANVASTFGEILVQAGATVVVSDQPPGWGPAGSIRAAMLSTALRGAERVVVTPVDMRPASPMAVTRLLTPLAFMNGQAQPLDDGFAHRGRICAVRFSRGHPVALTRAVLDVYYGGADTEVSPKPLREVLACLGDSVQTLEGNDSTVDFDSPTDVTAETHLSPSFWSPA
ncbi:MAG: hypothetical protein NVS3B20_16350 [Polyangiales bacterium]